MVTLPIVTAVTAGILLAFQQVLMFTVGMRRVSTRKGVGHEGDATLERLVRRHGNLAENSAIFLVVLGLLEMIGTGPGVVMTFASIFVAARLAHAIGFSFLGGSHGGEYTEGGQLAAGSRALGASATMLTGVAAGAFLAYTAILRFSA